MKLLVAIVIVVLAQLAHGQERFGRIVVLDGVTHRQVVQRDSDGKARFTIAGSIRATEAHQLQYRILRRGQIVDGFDWSAIEVGGGEWKVEIGGLPTGGPFDIEFRLLDDAGNELDQRRIHDVLVGDLWVLAGQSNMDGCGDLSEAEPPSEMVHAFSLADDWQVAEDPLHWCYESLYPVYLTSYVSPTERRAIAYAPRGPWPTWQRPEGLGAGLGIPFGKRIHQETGVPIGLILCSLGGTTMAQWSPDLAEQGDRSLYGAMMMRIKKVGGKVKGLLWYQGESDSYPAEISAQYANNLARLIQSIRSDLRDETLPVYVVQIGRQNVSPGADPHGRNLVREAQRTLPQELPHTGVASAIDLGLSSSAHLDTDGYKRIGRRLAKLALAQTYDVKRLAVGPTLRRVSVEGEGRQTIRVMFDHVNGKLQAPPRVAGFSIRNADGTQQLLNPLEAVIEPASPDSIIIRLSQPVPREAFLWYGYGWDPFCNIVDEQDMAVSAFGPIPLE